jgi:predicted dehydrogenase
VGQPLSATTVGIVGCGTILAQYLATFERLSSLRLVAVADIDAARARAVADAHPGVRALSVADLCADPLVEVVLNLTIPAAHAEVALQAIAAGKHVYGEKPLAVTTTEACTVLQAGAQGDRRRRHRDTDRGDRDDGDPRPRTLAPKP